MATSKRQSLPSIREILPEHFRRSGAAPPSSALRGTERAYPPPPRLITNFDAPPRPSTSAHYSYPTPTSPTDRTRPAPYPRRGSLSSQSESYERAASPVRSPVTRPRRNSSAVRRGMLPPGNPHILDDYASLAGALPPAVAPLPGVSPGYGAFPLAPSMPALPVRMPSAPSTYGAIEMRFYDPHAARGVPAAAEAEEDEESTGPGVRRRKQEERRHECAKCLKRFSRPSSLKIHENTHTGNKPFECPFVGCGRMFSVNSNMRRHYRTHGGGEGGVDEGEDERSNAYPREDDDEESEEWSSGER